MPATIQNTINRTATVREAFFDDYPQIAALQSEYGMRRESYDEWQHLWSANPAYLYLRENWPIGWVLESGGHVVGYFGNIPFLYELDGKPIIAATGHSWVVGPSYRRYSLMLCDKYLRQKYARLFLANTVTRSSASALSSFHSSQVPVGQWDHSSLWITNHRDFVASWLARKKYPLANVVSYPASIVLRVRDGFFKRRLRTRSFEKSDLRIENCASFDERFDLLWETLRHENRDKLLAVRSRAVLDWHFHHAIEENRLWIMTATDGSSLSAYAIFLRERGRNERMIFVDFQSKADSRCVFYPMLIRALERCDKEGIHMLQTTGLCPVGLGSVGEFAPYKIKQDVWTSWYKASDPHLTALLADPNVWAPSLFDGDATV